MGQARRVKFSLRARLFAAGVVVLASASVITLAIVDAAERELEDQAFEQLRSVRAAKAAQIEAEVSQFFGNLDTLARSQAAVTQLAPLAEAFAALDGPVDDEALRDYYANEFQPRTAGALDDAAAQALIPYSLPGRALQTLYIAQNPWPVGAKDGLLDAEGGSEYSRLHAEIHPFFRSALRNFGAYDIFLIDPDGTIVYSVFKEIDVGTSLLDGPHSESGLAEAWALSVETDDVGAVDFAPYTPSYLAPAAFLAQGVYDAQGNRVGSIAMQAPVDRINDVMTSKQRWAEVGLGESGETYIVARDGTMRNDSRFLIEDPEGFFEALTAAGLATTDIGRFETTIGLLPVRTEGSRAALRGEFGSAIFDDYRRVAVLSDYGPLNLPNGLDWAILSEIDEAEAFGPAHDLRQTSLVVLALSGACLFVAIWFGASRISRPLRSMDAETALVSELSFAGGDHYDTAPLDRIGGRSDEIGDLANSFSSLVTSLEQNIGARVAVEAELNVAADIQRSLLPLVFPIPPEHVEFHLHARLVPATEIGGDLWDWGTVDPDRHFFVVGDVSGKGIPAALFMAATKTLIRSGALSDEPLDEMMTRINAEIQHNNPEFMFATVWIGILDVRTGVVTFVNAGHNPPLLWRVDGSHEFLTESHGPFVGPVPGVTYSVGQLEMHPGDRLVVYSDGVTEAMDPDGTLFGEDRLAALELPGPAPEATGLIVDEVLAWEQGDRSDDVTVLVLDFLEARTVRTTRIEVPSGEPAAVVTEVNARVAEFGLQDEVLAKVQMVLDEVLVNVLTHGDATNVVVDLNHRPGWLVTTVSDDGSPFNPLTLPEPDVSGGLHERTPGGLGIHLVKSTMDELNYSYEHGRNTLEMTLEVPR